jgi:hypothetical protein
VAGEPDHHVLSGGAVEEVAGLIPANLLGLAGGLLVAAGVRLGGVLAATVVHDRSRLAGAEPPKISAATVPAWRSSRSARALISASPLEVSWTTLTRASFSCSPQE